MTTTLNVNGIDDFEIMDERVRAKYSKQLDLDQFYPVNFTLPANTSCMQTFQLDNDETGYIEEGHFENTSDEYPISLVFNYGDWAKTLQPGEIFKWCGEWQGSGNTPIFGVAIQTEVFQANAATIRGHFGGRA